MITDERIRGELLGSLEQLGREHGFLYPIAVAHELERLWAIVDKLPKCWRLDESGNRVQDVPVMPGMTVYWMYETARGGWCSTNGCVNYVKTWSEQGFRALKPIVVATDNGDPLLIHCASTREAAEAACDE